MCVSFCYLLRDHLENADLTGTSTTEETSRPEQEARKHTFLWLSTNLTTDGCNEKEGAELHKQCWRLSRSGSIVAARVCQPRDAEQRIINLLTPRGVPAAKDGAAPRI